MAISFLQHRIDSKHIISICCSGSYFFTALLCCTISVLLCSVLQVSMRSELSLHHCVLPIGDFAYLGTFTHETGVTYSIKVQYSRII